MGGSNYDAVVIGAGSVGTPLAMNLAEKGLRVLCLDSNPSAGQGNNKCAIGGARATHSEPAKVILGLRSLEIFRSWEREHGDDIGWYQGGYTYVAYDGETMDLFRSNVPGQQQAGLDIRIIDAGEMMELVPGINPDGLLGGTWSPGDGSASPMTSCYAFCRRARGLSAEFRFRERVTGMEASGGRITRVMTDRESYGCGAVINCAGSFALEVGRMAGAELPVYPESHEAGVTEPVKRLFDPMVVDIRKAPGSANYYFYQHDTGQVVFCITPDPPVPGTDTDETSGFLPLVALRMTDLYPRLGNLKVRRTWRGIYPMSPDGSPILDRVGPDNHYVAVGMCGQGFMLGPGIGEVMARFITGQETGEDRQVLDELRLDRQFTSEEALK
ncbi:MAG: FAD-binding oxidoreductase [Candidatus Fermentibacteraceae bacterium]|nr:FAD-binding oxidoreductase [Candidatus Fermentibacteraceae bacterium]MBN2609604.1 FAD-binding oxidoreductase [Candidatus Fermentibacteraceae bacterium]